VNHLELSDIAEQVIILLSSSAIRESGKSLGKASTEKVAVLYKTLREKFSNLSAREGDFLALLEGEGEGHDNQVALKILHEHMVLDHSFASELKNLMQHIKSCEDEKRQSVFDGVEVLGKATIGDIKQIIHRGQSTDAEQQIFSNVKIGDELKIGQIVQEN
jgi:hypothetical protein